MSALSKIKATTIIPILLGLFLLIIGGIIAYSSYSLSGVPRVFGPMGILVVISGVIVIITMER